MLPVWSLTPVTIDTSPRICRITEERKVSNSGAYLQFIRGQNRVVLSRTESRGSDKRKLRHYRLAPFLPITTKTEIYIINYEIQLRHK
jgi:hypothetical protein